MREKILNDLKEAMKNQEKTKLSVIRMVKGAMQMEELNLKRPLTDEEVVMVISKQIKTRKESIVEFEKGNRQDLIDQTNAEIEILNTYMPEQLSEDEVLKVIKMLKNVVLSVILLTVSEGRDIMTKVVVKNGNVENAIRTFKQKNAKSGLLKEVRERQEGYLKPGAKRRKARKEAIRNSRKRARENY